MYSQESTGPFECCVPIWNCIRRPFGLDVLRHWNIMLSVLITIAAWAGMTYGLAVRIHILIHNTYYLQQLLTYSQQSHLSHHDLSLTLHILAHWLICHSSIGLSLATVSVSICSLVYEPTAMHTIVLISTHCSCTVMSAWCADLIVSGAYYDCCAIRHCRILCFDHRSALHSFDSATAGSGVQLLHLLGRPPLLH